MNTMSEEPMNEEFAHIGTQLIAASYAAISRATSPAWSPYLRRAASTLRSAR
jgi:hypothetical protein